MFEIDFGQSNITRAILRWNQFFAEKTFVEVVFRSSRSNSSCLFFIGENLFPVAKTEMRRSIGGLVKLHSYEIDTVINSHLYARILSHKFLMTSDHTVTCGLSYQFLKKSDLDPHQISISDCNRPTYFDHVEQSTFSSTVAPTTNRK